MCDNANADPEHGGDGDAKAAVIMPKKARFDRSKKCVRCKTRPGNIVVKHSVYCIGCFDYTVTHKFRRALDTSFDLGAHSQYDQPQPTHNVLLALTTGLESALLVDLVEKECFPARELGEEGRRKPMGKRELLWKGEVLVYIEMSGAIPGRADETDRVVRTVAQLPPHRDRQLVLLRIEDAFDPAWWSSVAPSSPLPPHLSSPSSPSGSTPPTPLANLQAFLGALPTPSARSSMLAHLTRLLLLHTARAHNCSHVLMSDSLTRLSVRLIEGIASGAGFHVAAEREEVWRGLSSTSAGDGDVMIVKPLRDVGAKECAASFRWRKLDMLGSRSMLPIAQQGIGRLTQDFIVGLDRDFPSTVSAIVKTLAKVESKEEPDAFCMLCQRPALASAYEWKKHVSLSTIAPVRAPPGPTDTGTDSGEAAARLQRTLCYACHTAFTSRGAKSSLDSAVEKAPMPVWTIRDEIKEFLLDDDQ